jgi:hypothetical protein
MVIAVAIDENTDAIRGLAENITYPVLMDPLHVLTELYAMSNVPSVVWIDENDRIARPNAGEFGTDMFSEITGITREGHMNAVRDWVRTGALPDDAAYEVADLDDDEIAARLHFKLAAHARATGDDDGAARHFDRAVELAPLDFTIARASIPLRGGDPFGQEFFALYERWKAEGTPFHGIPRPRADS